MHEESQGKMMTSEMVSWLETIMGVAPPCPKHGEGCIPYIVELLVSMTENDSLRSPAVLNAVQQATGVRYPNLASVPLDDLRKARTLLDVNRLLELGKLHWVVNVEEAG